MGKLKRKHYEKLLAPMEEELVCMARWARVTGQRICVLFEGRDTAGKGGAIRALSGRLNPRQCRIVALAETHRARSDAVVLSNATSRICPPPGKSCCSTAAGTIAPGWSKSWATLRKPKWIGFSI